MHWAASPESAGGGVHPLELQQQTHALQQIVPPQQAPPKQAAPQKQALSIPEGQELELKLFPAPAPHAQGPLLLNGRSLPWQVEEIAMSTQLLPTPPSQTGLECQECQAQLQTGLEEETSRWAAWETFQAAKSGQDQVVQMDLMIQTLLALMLMRYLQMPLPLPWPWPWTSLLVEMTTIDLGSLGFLQVHPPNDHQEMVLL